MLFPLIVPNSSVDVPVIRNVPTPEAFIERTRVLATVTLEATSTTAPLPSIVTGKQH